MTDMLQKSENVAKNVANENSQDLTDKWKKGELLEEFYYVKCDWSDEVEIRYVHNSVDDWKAIIAPVPSYEELQNMNKAVNECMSANIKLVEENKNLSQTLKASEYLYAKSQKDILDLKELLKECRGSVATLLAKRITEVNSIKQKELLTKIDEVLKCGNIK